MLGTIAKGFAIAAGATAGLLTTVVLVDCAERAYQKYKWDDRGLLIAEGHLMEARRRKTRKARK